MLRSKILKKKQLIFLATNAALTAVDNEIPNVSKLVEKNW